MAESKQFEGIPEDVKREMLMLFETYSKNELINKLRSLRESPKSSEKINASSEGVVQLTSSEDLQSRIEVSERVETKNDDVLTSTNNSEQLNVTNGAAINSDESSDETTPHQSSENEQSHSVDDSNTESVTLDYNDIENNSAFNPVVCLLKMDKLMINREMCLLEIPNDKTEDSPSKSTDSHVALTNVRKISKRKSKIGNNAKTNILTQCPRENPNESVSEEDLKKSPDVSKARTFSPKSSTRSKSRLQCSKRKKEEVDQEITPEDIPTNDESKSLVKAASNSLKKCSPRKNDSKKDDKTLDISPSILSNQASTLNRNVVSDKTKNSCLKIKSVSLVKKKHAEVLEKSKVFCDTSPDLKDTQGVEKLTQKSLRKDNSPFHSETNSSVIDKEKKLSDNVKNTNVTVAKRSYKRKPQQKEQEVEPTSGVDSRKQSSDNTHDNFSSSTPSICISESTNSGENVPNLTASTLNKEVAVTRSTSLRKRNNRISSDNKTAITSKPKVVKKKPFTPSNSDTKEQTLSDANAEEDHRILSNVSEAAVMSTELNSDNQAPIIRSLRNKRALSFGEAVSNLEQQRPKRRTSSSPVKKNEKSNLTPQKMDVASTVKDKKMSSEGEIEDTDEMKQNAEAYSKLSKMCSQQGLNLDDIFRRKEIQEMIEKYKNNTDAIVFIGTHKCSSTGKIEPIVHVHKSKKVLLENLIQMKSGASLKGASCK